VRSGLLRNRLVIEKLTTPEVRDPFGSPVETWEEHATRWGAVEPLTGREFFEAQQMQAAADHMIRLRYDSATAAITEAMRIRHGAKLFDVQSVRDPDSRHEEIQIVARVRT
jgi:SPP1 family predicted phage head-tail adaptor